MYCTPWTVFHILLCISHQPSVAYYKVYTIHSHKTPTRVHTALSSPIHSHVHMCTHTLIMQSTLSIQQVHGKVSYKHSWHFQVCLGVACLRAIAQCKQFERMTGLLLHSADSVKQNLMRRRRGWEGAGWGGLISWMPVWQRASHGRLWLVGGAVTYWSSHWILHSYWLDTGRHYSSCCSVHMLCPTVVHEENAVLLF